MRPKPTVLIILDGWGIAPPSAGNAITQANPKFFRYLVNNFPSGTLQASGEAVGLAWKEMGNSEVGHLNIGAGRIVYQSLMRISKAIESGAIYQNEVLQGACQRVKEKNSALHFIGLVSNGGIHSYLPHLYGFLEMAKQQGIEKIYLHAILDGRDTDYNSGKHFVQKILERAPEYSLKIASLSGRFYAMDRDNHWERTQKAYEAMALGKAEKSFSDPLAAIQDSYDNNVFDEEFVPCVLTENGQPVATIKKEDAVIFFNFRADRARQLTKAFVLPDFDKFSRPFLEGLYFVTLTEYEKGLPVKVAFPREQIKEPLAEVISQNNLRQLHIAESEKYAHVTYFFNGGQEQPFPLEDDVIIPSPRVASYSEAPEMSAKLVAKRVQEEIMKDAYDFIVINFANADMVGHTGDLNAAIKAVKTVDSCLQEIIELVLIKNGAAVVIADHGNAESMFDEIKGEIEKEHTNNPVPIIAVKKDFAGQKVGLLAPQEELYPLKATGLLADVAPTILKLMELPKSPYMNGMALV